MNIAGNIRGKITSSWGKASKWALAFGQAAM